MAFIRKWRGSIFLYVVLAAYAVISLFPIVLVVMNSFKGRRDLFRVPYQPPVWFSFDEGLHVVNTFTLSGYGTVFARSRMLWYYLNSLMITSISLVLIIVLGLMLAYAMTEFVFRGRAALNVFVALGIMLPVTLGTSTIIRFVNWLGIYDTQWALILVYVARGLPVCYVIMAEFLRSVSSEIKEAARIDGANEFQILFGIVAPLTRPAIATVLAFQIIPVWNDLWFPLTLAPGERARTVTLGVSTFVGQYQTDWTALLAALSVAMIPLTILFVIFSRQFVSGLTQGAVK